MELVTELQKALSKNRLYWMASDTNFRRVVRIPGVEVDADDDGVPIWCAYLEGGGHLDLNNVDPNDFFVMKPFME